MMASSCTAFPFMMYLKDQIIFFGEPQVWSGFRLVEMQSQVPIIGPKSPAPLGASGFNFP
jgi:hypothetical protein